VAAKISVPIVKAGVNPLAAVARASAPSAGVWKRILARLQKRIQVRRRGEDNLCVFELLVRLRDAFIVWRRLLVVVNGLTRTRKTRGSGGATREVASGRYYLWPISSARAGKRAIPEGRKILVGKGGAQCII
jgi:hypothetical protein